MYIGFRFEVIYRDDDLIEVRISCWTGSFGGTANIYMSAARLAEMASHLNQFPTSVSDRREIMLGTFDAKSEGGVNMEFYCADTSGHTFVRSKIESGTLSGKPVQCVTLSLPIEAAAVDSFVDELRQVGANKSGTAHLAGAPDR